MADKCQRNRDCVERYIKRPCILVSWRILWSRSECMTCVVWSVDHWIEYVKYVSDHYNPGDFMLPIVAWEQRRVVESRGCIRSFSWGATHGLVLELRREAIVTFTEDLYLVRYGRFIGISVCWTKLLRISYGQTNTKVYIHTYFGRIMDRMWWYYSGKTQECRDTQGKTDRSGRRRYGMYQTCTNVNRLTKIFVRYTY